MRAQRSASPALDVLGLLLCVLQRAYLCLHADPSADSVGTGTALAPGTDPDAAQLR